MLYLFGSQCSHLFFFFDLFLGDDGVASNLVFCIIDTDFLVSLPSWAAVKGILEEGGAALIARGGVGVLELGELLKVGFNVTIGV